MINLSDFDGVEVHPVSREVHDNGQEVFEVLHDRDDPALYCWSVYLHLRAGGVECIADCMTEGYALTVAAGLQALLTANSETVV